MIVLLRGAVKLLSSFFGSLMLDFVSRTSFLFSALMPFAQFSPWLFDLDGTLIDSNSAVVECMKVTVREVGGEVTDEQELRNSFGRGLMNTMARWVPEGKLDMALARYEENFPHLVQANLRFYDGVIELLESFRAKGIPMAVVTGNKQFEAKGIFDQLQFGHYFDAVVCADSIPFQKPSPEPVLEALRLLGQSADRAVFIGDSEHDIRAGRLAGVKTIAVHGGSSPRERLEAAGPDYFIDSIREVLKKIES